MTINGNADGQITNPDGSIIHFHFDPSANNNNNGTPAGGIFLSNIGTTPATTADFQAALELIQFSPGAGDGNRTVTWAAYDGSQFSPTETTTINVDRSAFSFTAIDVPGASSTVVAGINDAGYLVGQETVSGQEFAFTYDGTSFHLIQEQSAHNTVGTGINNAGVIAGYYEPNSSTPRYGFTDDGHGHFTQINLSPNISSGANGINDAGVVVGQSYLHTVSGVTPVYTGYIDDHGTVTYLNAPGTVTSSGYTAANGINDAGHVAGDFETAYGTGNQGFLYEGGQFTVIDDPNAGPQGTSAQGINNVDQIVGFYTDSAGMTHGFIDNNGVFTTVDDPLGVNGTLLTGINDAGQVSGYYVDANHVDHGFVANQTTTLANTTISAAASLEIEGANSQTITFAADSGTLVLDNPTAFTGKIAGVSGTDALDLHGFSAVSTTAHTGNGSYNAGSNTTTLTVTDSSDNLTETFKLTGDVSNSSWSVSDDGHGWAKIVDPPAPVEQLGPMIMHDPGLVESQTITATAPNQTLPGTAANDSFVFNFKAIGSDIVTGFQPGADLLQFGQSIFANAQAAFDALHDDGHGNTVVTLDAHDTVTLGGVLKAQLHVGDFHVV